jgi:hypothetical protein
MWLSQSHSVCGRIGPCLWTQNWVIFFLFLGTLSFLVVCPHLYEELLLLGDIKHACCWVLNKKLDKPNFYSELTSVIPKDRRREKCHLKRLLEKQKGTYVSTVTETWCWHLGVGTRNAGCTQCAEQFCTVKSGLVHVVQLLTSQGVFMKTNH